MNLKIKIDNFITQHLNQRNYDYDKFKKTQINQINLMENILKGKVIELKDNKELYCFSSQNKCQSEKLGFDVCCNTTSFKTNNRINLCWKHSYLYSQDYEE